MTTGRRSRVRKEGEGGPGNGPLAPVDVWEGQDVHVDAIGRPRKKLPQGIAVPPSVHKSCGLARLFKGRKKKRCPPGEHRHGKFPCHPEERKHRGKGAKKEERPVPSPRALMRRIKELRWEMHYGDVDDDQREKLRDTISELYDQWGAARRWERSSEGKAWMQREKVRRAQAAGVKGFDYYAKRVDDMEAEIEALHEKRRPLSAKHDSMYEEGINWKEIRNHPVTEQLREVVDQIQKKQKARDRAISAAGITVAREWADVLRKVSGGVEAQIAAMRPGSRSYAHYDLETKIIGFSKNALKLMYAYKKNPESIDDTATNPISTTIHEMLHSVNPADIYLGPRTFIGALEEGLTEAIAHRMTENPDIIEALLGRKVKLNDTVTSAYASYVTGLEYLAEQAATAHGTDPEWFLGKWKFHVPNSQREQVITEDSRNPGVRMIITRGVSETELAQAREEREQAKLQRVGKSFASVVQKVLGNLWSAPSFTFKARGGPQSAPASGAPSNVDVRHTGSPPEGVGWQKLPRQGGAPGGVGAGAVEAAVEEQCEECYN